MSFSVLALTAAIALGGMGSEPSPVAPASIVSSTGTATVASTRPPVVIKVPQTVTEVIDPYAKDQILEAPESPATVSPRSTPTGTVSETPSPLTASATGTPAATVKRISAIHIARPNKVVVVTTPAVPDTTTVTAAPETVTVTETETKTITVDPPAVEESAVGRAKVEKPVERGTDCVPPRGSYNGVEPYVAIIGAHIQQRFGVTEVGGKAGRASTSEHPIGLALDFMTNTGNVDGNAIRDYLLENADEFNVKYVIWQQQITLAGGEPRDMEDRGSDTANHRDHVHASFNYSPGPVTPTC